MPTEIKDVLSEYFVFPNDDVVMRIFVETKTELFLFDAVLLTFTQWNMGDELLNKILGTMPKSILSKLLYCLFVSEFFLSCDDKSFCSDEIYKRCLSYLFENCQEAKLKKLFHLCTRRFSLLCDRMGDVRTSESLCRLLEANSKGIFL